MNFCVKDVGCIEGLGSADFLRFLMDDFVILKIMAHGPTRTNTDFLGGWHAE
ncbi:MAG: hypothetical protein V1889_00565 [archaeon]